MELDGKMPVGYRRITRLMALFGAVVMVISIRGCTAGQGPPESENTPALSQEDKGKRLLVVIAIFPYYDFVRRITGDKVKLKLVVPTGMDSHSFEPAPVNMIAMQEADVLICNDGEMEQWVKKALSSLGTSHMKILAMMGYVDVVEEEHVEGIGENEHHHEDVYEEDGHEKDDHEEGDGHEMHIEYDEHIQTSPVNAQAIVKIISRTPVEATPGEQNRFEASTQAYLQELEDLDSQFRQVANQGRLHMIMAADEFPFRYFADEYGLSCRAAFSGCNGDTEPSASTAAYPIDKIKEGRIPAIYYLGLSSHRTAEIIQEGTGAAPLLPHSCHNVTREQLNEGVTYLQLMKQNVENLRYGLEQPEPEQPI